MKLLQKSLGKLHLSLKATEQEIKKLEKQNTMPRVSKQSRLRRTLSSLAGLCIFVMAIAGLVLSGIYFRHVRIHKQETVKQERIAYYTEFIEPVVLFDTGEFVDTDNANNLSLLIPSFFKAQEIAYADSEERESLTETDKARYIIHADAVEQASQLLFGRSVICQTFTLDGLTFEYMENEKYFLSPITLRIAMYEPEILEYTPTDTGTELLVRYVEIAGKSKNAGKTMKITLQGEYQKDIITAIEASAQ